MHQGVPIHRRRGPQVLGLAFIRRWFLPIVALVAIIGLLLFYTARKNGGKEPLFPTAGPG